MRQAGRIAILVPFVAVERASRGGQPGGACEVGHLTRYRKPAYVITERYVLPRPAHPTF